MSLTIPCLLLAGLSFAPVDDDLAFLEGTWHYRKDGFDLTHTIEPALSGRAWRETLLLDEVNRVVATALLDRDPASGLWRRTWFNGQGGRATFRQVPAEDGHVALEMSAYDGRPLDPSPSRLVYTEDPTGFTLDWQSRGSDGSSWQPRPEPFVHRAVDRPAPPAGDGRLAFASNRSGDWEVYTMAPDGSDVVNLSDAPGGDHRPRWIAGGTRLAFLSQRGTSDGGWRRWSVDRDGTDLRLDELGGRIGASAAGDFPQLSPDGSWIVYAAEREGELDLSLCRFDGGGERALAPAPGADRRPRWSPDGTQVLFESERDGDPELYVVDVASGSVTRLTHNPGLDRYARWSPDGQRIVHAAEVPDAPSLELFVMAADGSDRRRLTHNEAEDGEPSWSPDGSRIVFRSNAFDSPELCVVSVETGAIVRLTDDPGYDGEPVWSPPNP